MQLTPDIVETVANIPLGWQQYNITVLLFYCAVLFFMLCKLDKSWQSIKYMSATHNTYVYADFCVLKEFACL